MDKDKQKPRPKYEKYNPSIIKRIKEKHGFTSRFIYASLRGERQSESSTEIVKDYKKMESEINKTLKQL